MSPLKKSGQLSLQTLKKLLLKRIRKIESGEQSCTIYEKLPKVKITNPTAKLGEDKACEYLKNLGFKIIERNFRKGYGEIDIVAIEETEKDEKVLVFLEVKTRTSNQFGTPFEGITYWKLKTLIKTAQFYKLTHQNLPESMRIDAVSVALNGNVVQNIELMKNISGF